MKYFYLAGFIAYLLATLALIFIGYKPDEFAVFVAFIVTTLTFGGCFLNAREEE